MGLSVPQGGGKTTLCNCLEQAMLVLDIKTGQISYDDLYKTHEELERLREQNPDSIYYQGRGVAGTHDLELGVTVLNEMIYSDTMEIPRYKKSLHNGKGDRLPQSQWTRMSGPLDLVLVEGWMLGF